MSTVLEQLQYGFDRNSRRTWQRRSLTDTQDQHYGYDTLGQVSAAARGSLNLNATAISGRPASAQSWNYDPTGNWRGYHAAANGTSTLNQHRVHDRGNRLTQIEDNPNNMILDRVGRMRQMAPDAGGDWDGKLEITWDAWSRIMSVRNNGEVVGDYAYDGSHRRITREVDGEKLHSYYNDAWRPVEERKDAETTASSSCLWGARHRDDLVRRDRAVGGTTLNETRYVLMDYFNPAAITDETGEVKERYAFSAFGLRTILNPDFTERSNSECAMEFAFQGQFLDGESGLMNYGYRYYAPQMGRWTCKDPIGERGGFNLYGVVENDPVNKVDHLGLLDVEFKPGQPENVPVVDDGAVKCQTYSPACTTYDREISCTCSGEKKCTVKCKVVLNPTIHMRWDWIGFGLEKTRIGFRKVQVSAGEAFGHEQRHILDRIKRVTEHVVDPLGREKSEFSTPNTCAINAEAYKIKYKSTLETQLTYKSTGWHDWDPKTIVPGEAEPLPPLPGSTTVPSDVPFSTQENTD